jgi:hypothetical protein
MPVCDAANKLAFRAGMRRINGAGAAPLQICRDVGTVIKRHEG